MDARFQLGFHQLPLIKLSREEVERHHSHVTLLLFLMDSPLIALLLFLGGTLLGHILLEIQDIVLTGRYQNRVTTVPFLDYKNISELEHFLEIHLNSKRHQRGISLLVLLDQLLILLI